MLDINGFWKSRLETEILAPSPLTNGWSQGAETLSTFVEAPLKHITDDYPDVDPWSAPVILVSAPGAVGKSTLSRQIAAATRGILIDLAKTDAVGANFLTGGLAENKLLDSFIQGNAALLVDGLDEARLRVTSDGFAGFIKDVARLADSQRKPIVLFGRTGAVFETWCYLDDHKLQPAVLEIQMHPIKSAKHLASAILVELREAKAQKEGIKFNLAATRDADQRAIDILIERLQDATVADGGRFVGYAPVLQAVARQIASYPNPSELVSKLERDQQPTTIEDIIIAILEREQQKLSTLPLSDRNLFTTLYSPDEQVARLMDRLYGIPFKVDLPAMTPADMKRYHEALETWVGEHPFLDGAGMRTSSEVFSGYLTSRAIKNDAITAATRNRIVGGAAKVNPFLSVFYLPDNWSDQPEDTPAKGLSDIPLVFASLSASVPQSDHVQLTISSERDDDKGNLEIEVEISRTSRNKAPGEGSNGSQPIRHTTKAMRFVYKNESTLAFGGSLGDVTVQGDDLDVEIGTGGEVIISAPTLIDVKSITLNASKLSVEPSAIKPSVQDSSVGEGGVVTLACGTFVSGLQSRPEIRGNTRLRLQFPGSESFPWNEFSVTPIKDVSEQVHEAFRRMLKILLPFKSDRYGELAKYKKFVDHKRRIKGIGEAVRDQLLEERIIFPREYLYVLDAQRFQEMTGLNYHMMRERQLTPLTVAFLERALQRIRN